MEPVDLTRVRTISLRARANKVRVDRFARPPRKGQTAAEFLAGLPTILAGEDFRAVVDAVVAARRAGRPVLAAVGAHVIKCGLNPVLIDLMRRGVLTGIAMNGACAIHDVELALIGETSEDVAAGLKTGAFGMVRETGEFMHRAINRVLDRRELGMGALLGDAVIEAETPNREYSVLATARELRLPATVHVAIGTDIIHMHPSADGAALGLATFNDFRLFCGAVKGLTGGVFLNMGSAVIMPEVFLKALTVAQNLGADLRDFTTVNLDMTAHYRPGENVVRRPAVVGGRGVTLMGRHELMIPLLAQAVVEATP
jgi:hypothetical protein